MFEFSIFIVFLAGLISFLSPCVLPIVFGYVGYIGGSLEDGKDSSRILILRRAIGFVMGFSTIFIALGASASFVGQMLFNYIHILTKISGIFIILFGLNLLGVFSFSMLRGRSSFIPFKRATNWFGAFLLGMSFGTGWTPCVGSVLGSILMYAGASATLYRGVLMLAVYSLGLGVPFILTALLSKQASEYFARHQKVIGYISKVGGVFLILMGILIFFDKMSVITEYFGFINVSI